MKTCKCMIYLLLCSLFLISCQTNDTSKQVAELTSKGWDVLRHPGLYIKPGEMHSPIAFGYFEQALAMDSTYAPALAGLADRYVLVKQEKLGRDKAIAKAKELIEKAIQLAPDLHLAYLAKGRTERHENKNKAAVKSYQKAVNLNPDDAEAYDRLADIKIWGEGNPEKGLELALKAVQLDPQHSMAKKTVAMAYRYMDDFDLALQWIDQALGQFKDGICFVEKGTILFFKKDYDAAVEVLKEGLTFYPQGRQLRTLLAWTYEKQGKIEESFSTYKELNEDWLLGWAYCMKGDNEKAREFLDDLLKKEERGEPNAWNIGWIYFGLKDYENAITYFEKGMDQSIEYGWFGNYKYWITHDDSLEELKSDPRFVALIDRVNSYPISSM